MLGSMHVPVYSKWNESLRAPIKPNRSPCRSGTDGVSPSRAPHIRELCDERLPSHAEMDAKLDRSSRFDAQKKSQRSWVGGGVKHKVWMFLARAHNVSAAPTTSSSRSKAFWAVRAVTATTATTRGCQQRGDCCSSRELKQRGNEEFCSLAPLTMPEETVGTGIIDYFLPVGRRNLSTTIKALSRFAPPLLLLAYHLFL